MHPCLLFTQDLNPKSLLNQDHPQDNRVSIGFTELVPNQLQLNKLCPSKFVHKFLFDFNNIIRVIKYIADYSSFFFSCISIQLFFFMNIVKCVKRMSDSLLFQERAKMNPSVFSGLPSLPARCKLSQQVQQKTYYFAVES